MKELVQEMIIILSISKFRNIINRNILIKRTKIMKLEKKILLIVTLLISLLSFSQAEPMITWENCSTEGDMITDKLMSDNPKLYEQILVLVVYKSKKLGYVPSSNWIHREINRQCFALKAIGQWISIVGGVKTSAYKERVEGNLSRHMIFIQQYGELLSDYGSLYKAEFLPKERK